MKLQRLAGMGPRAAIVSGVTMIVLLLDWIFGSAAFGSGRLGFLAAVLFLLAGTAWLGAMAVAGLDIDWMAHPDTHNGRLLASLWLAIAGSFLPPLLAVSVLVGAPAWVTQLILCLIGLVAGGFTILHNLEAHRVGILSGLLPWVGILSGVFFLVLWLGVLLSLPPLTFFGLFVGGILYAAWAIWLGIKLGRKAPVAAVT
ncbi:MAG TPA: hypothetical protein VNG93_06370 [Candidatus Dormibacteraeota bacterium]|nr:hypothetical protein [Candidatus Dormibacteraeota bacterium]